MFFIETFDKLYDVGDGHVNTHEAVVALVCGLLLSRLRGWVAGRFGLQEIYSHMIDGQDDEAARKWEELQNQTTGEEPQQKGCVQ